MWLFWYSSAYSRLLDGHYVKNGSSSDVARETLHEEDFHLIVRT